MKITIDIPDEEIRDNAFMLFKREGIDFSRYRGMDYKYRKAIEEYEYSNKFKECVICALEDSIDTTIKDYIIKKAANYICLEFETELDEWLEKEKR